MTHVKLFIDGGEVCALIGANIQEGIAGFGKNIPDALRDLAGDPKIWSVVLTPPQLRARE